jgi:hypothetical protein
MLAGEKVGAVGEVLKGQAHFFYFFFLGVVSEVLKGLAHVLKRTLCSNFAAATTLLLLVCVVLKGQAHRA